MLNPIAFYLDSVDTDAFEKAESGAPVYPKADWPILPMILPWIMGAPLLALLPSSSRWWGAVFIIVLVTSFVSYLGVGAYFYQRVQIHRRALNQSDNKES